MIRSTPLDETGARTLRAHGQLRSDDRPRDDGPMMPVTTTVGVCPEGVR